MAPSCSQRNEVAAGRRPDDELIDEPPAWRPLTQEPIDDLADQQPRNLLEATAEEVETYDRLTVHSTHGLIKPPTAEGIFFETQKRLDDSPHGGTRLVQEIANGIDPDDVEDAG